MFRSLSESRSPIAASADSGTVPRRDLDRISSYVVRGRSRIAGYLSRLDGEIFATLLVEQLRRGAKGDALEIGVHHGRSFSLLSLCLSAGEVAIALDIFDNQELNIGDPSGKGNLAKFKSNVARYGDPSKMKIISGSSLEVQPDDIKSISRGLRFVSVDGGHWYDVVVNDLRLAADCAGPNCVIALDDIFHPDYPEVAAAYYSWITNKPNFVPLCISRDKIYLSRPNDVKSYHEALLRNAYLRFNCKKQITYLGHEILFFTGRYSGLSGLVQQYLKMYFPKTLEFLKRKKGKITLLKFRSRQSG